MDILCVLVALALSTRVTAWERPVIALSVTEPGDLFSSGLTTINSEQGEVTTNSTAGITMTLQPWDVGKWTLYFSATSCLSVDFSSSYTTVDAVVYTKPRLQAILGGSNWTYGSAEDIRGIPGGEWRNTRGASAVLPTNTSDFYGFLMYNTGGQTQNGSSSTDVAYRLTAHNKTSPVCQSVLNGSFAPSPSAPVRSEAGLTPYFESYDETAPQNFTAVASLLNASCVSFQVNVVNVTNPSDVDIGFFLVSVNTSEAWLTSNFTTPIPYLGAGCLQTPNALTTPGATTIVNSKATAKALSNATASLTQPCQVNIDGLDPKATYIIWGKNFMSQGNTAQTFVRVIVKGTGTCTGVTFSGVQPPPLPLPVPAPCCGPPDSLSGGAIAGIAVAGAAGAAVVAFLAVCQVRRRRRQNIGPSLTKESSFLARASSEYFSKPHSNALPTHKVSPTVELSWREGDDFCGFDQSSNSTRMIGSRDHEAVHHGTHEAGASPRTGNLLSSADIRGGHSSTVHIKKERGRAPFGSSGGVSHSSSSTAGSRQAVSIQTSSTTHGSSGTRSSGNMHLPELWQVKADDIVITRDASGGLMRLGSGAYGTVFKGTIDGVTEVAVKAFHDIPDEKEQESILREAAILKNCRDRNVVNFLGACIVEGQIMLVTEYMEAGDLWHAIARHHNSLCWYSRGQNIALQVARGLHYLHRNKIIHFDLKSANVLLTREGVAKISDVGFAKLLSNSHISNTSAGFTFAWAAPEVLLGRPCTEKVDIYSYGVLLWEIVTGGRPTRGLLRATRVPDECPGEVENLIQVCMAENPDDRPTCREIVEILVGLLHDNNDLSTST